MASGEWRASPLAIRHWPFAIRGERARMICIA
jgi:hypothetical protein